MSEMEKIAETASERYTIELQSGDVIEFFVNGNPVPFYTQTISAGHEGEGSMTTNTNPNTDDPVWLG